MLLKLKNVSKYYYNNGVIASGFDKVSVSFDTSEFVVITGESGSGKSTLLNVISGLDSYEDGEMYINSEETSHYSENDFLEYRNKYISNIFQNFNLVNSYTVYQNVELVMLLNGFKKKDVKDKVLEIIDKVNMTKYKNTLVSKLSGGQKQRVAIARALAKESPIIICDEPTGNLDSKQAKDVVKLLKEVSKDKLVIMVTHDLDLAEELATRIIKMHDGKIVSDKKVKDMEEKKDVTFSKYKNITFMNMFRLGFRNTFNIIPKFLLIFVVFIFITLSLFTVVGGFRNLIYEESEVGENYYFNNTRTDRIIIKKLDNSVITEDDFNKIKKLNNIDSVNEYDLLTDNNMWLSTVDDSYYSVSGLVKDIELFDSEIDYGRLPENDNEIVISVNKNDYYFKDNREKSLEHDYYVNGDKINSKLRIVGINYIDNYDSLIYVSKAQIKKFIIEGNKNYSNIYVEINNKKYYGNSEYNYMISPSNRVQKGNAYIYEVINYSCSYDSCKNKNIKVFVDNLFYHDEINLKINNIYNEKNSKDLLGIDKDSFSYGTIYINEEEYNKLFDKESYQASVFVLDKLKIDETEKELNSLGFNTLKMKDIISNSSGDLGKILKIVRLVVLIILIVTMFFISYFVIKLILKSRNIYYSTLRILGAKFKNIKRILDIELFCNATLGYILFVIFIVLIKNNILDISYFYNLSRFLTLKDYIMIYIILIMMSYLISTRYASKIFKNSVMKVYRERV